MATVAVVGLLIGCADVAPLEFDPPPPVPEIARGTVGAYVRFSSVRALPAVGYGLVIGLKGTGSKDIPAALRRRLYREMYQANIRDAAKILESPNTAAVLVRGTIMPYHTRGSRFDVTVKALGTQITSLEGGTLVRTRLSPLVPSFDGPPALGAPMATAHGPVVVRATAASEREARLTDPKQGRVIGGGRFSGDRRVPMELLEPNLRMCLLIEQRINARFPRAALAKSRSVYTTEAFRSEGAEPEPMPGPQKPEPPPKETQYYLLLTVPPEYAGRWTHFIQIVASLYIDQRERAVADRVQYLIGQLRDEEQRVTACYGLEAIGSPSITPLTRLLEDGDRDVRVAAASVLIALGDTRGTSVLIAAATDPDSPYRLAAIHALVRTNEPKSIRVLQDLTASPDLACRFAAYESLRNIPGQTVVEELDRTHKIQRFSIDTVNCEGPPAIVAQAVDDPRLVFFGTDIRFRPPIFFDEGRYWAIADEGATAITIMPPKPAKRRPLLSKEFTVGMSVLDYVILMDRLGATYPDILNRLRTAERLGRITAQFVLRRKPASMPVERAWE